MHHGHSTSVTTGVRAPIPDRECTLGSGPSASPRWKLAQVDYRFATVSQTTMNEAAESLLGTADPQPTPNNGHPHAVRPRLCGERNGPRRRITPLLSRREGRGYPR